MQSCDNNYVVADVSKSGVWGVLAQKAKQILEDDESSPHPHPHPHHSAIASEKLKTHSFNTFAPPLVRSTAFFFFFFFFLLLLLLLLLHHRTFQICFLL